MHFNLLRKCTLLPVIIDNEYIMQSWAARRQVHASPLDYWAARQAQWARVVSQVPSYLANT